MLLNTSIKTLHLCTQDGSGGAARAAYRIHQAQVATGMDSRMRVVVKGTGDERVTGGISPLSIAARLRAKLHRRALAHSRNGWVTDNPVLHTFGDENAGLVEEINASRADIIHLHWVSGMLSVTDIGRLTKPIVWTLHDMWTFCGGEHYAPDDAHARFRVGYRPDNRPFGEAGPDLNRQTWDTKRRTWADQRFTFVSPSLWLAECARESALVGHCPVYVIPNPLDTNYPWRPIPRDIARIALGLPPAAKLILMGADGGVSDPRKGGDLLRKSVVSVIEKTKGADLRVMIYGQGAPSKTEPAWPCPVHWLGAIRDDRLLALAYAAADVTVVPSRQDNLPNTAIEAQACGTPVVGFDIGGLPDIVEHQMTGWLAPAFDTNSLAHGIEWVLANEPLAKALGVKSRERAVARFSPAKVAGEYLRVYQDVLQQSQVSYSA